MVFLHKIKCTFLLILMVSLLILQSISILSAKAQQSNVVLNFPEEIKQNREELIQIKFPYGSIFKDQDVKNNSVSVILKGKGLEIDRGSIKDQYYTENIEQDGKKYPKRHNCSENYSGESYLISPQLSTLTGIAKYGLQTANSPKSASGSDMGILSAKHTGCLVINLKVSGNAKQGDITEITFNPDILNSQDYGVKNRPGPQSVRLKIASDKTCPTGQEFVFGECKMACEEGELRNLDTVICQKNILKCGLEEEIFNNTCVAKCRIGEKRDLSGGCVIPNGFVCNNQSCIPSVTCVDGKCGDIENKVTLGDVETRVLTTLFIIIFLSITIFISSFLIRRSHFFDNKVELQAPHDPNIRV